MAGHLYGYTTQSSASAAAAAASAASSRALTEPYYPSSLFLSQATTDAYSRTASHLASLASWSSAVAAATVDDASVSGIKRSAEALYPSTILGAHSMAGHDAWYSSDALAKRLRYENASNLPLYPQRPGEKDCAHYMLTRTCKFGDSCRFDHPHWVPEGGIPEWKEVPPVGNDLLPERPGELDCPYFLKTQRCKFGVRCRFNHPKDGSENDGALPDRPSETPCAFYLKTGMCKFGATCKFHHPKDIQLPLVGHDSTSSQYEVAQNEGISVTPAVLYNSKELPVRPGEADCPFYLKTGSCKYGITCRYSHPDRNVIIPQAAGLGHALAVSPAAALSLGVNPVASLYQTIDPRLAQATVGIAQAVYPQRPGQMECDFYMKTGICKFGERCKYHHPFDRSAPTSSTVQAQQNIKLTLAGLPRREGSIICPYYLKTGTCKYGATCKFDHPPPGEVMAMGSTTQEATGNGEKEEEGSESESD